MVYGVVRTDMNIRTRRDVKKFLKGFLAKLQDYEPVDFWGEEESNTNVSCNQGVSPVFPELTP